MRSLGWVVSIGMLLAIPVWAWDRYGPYPGYGGGTRSLQLQTDVSNLERQVRELQRQVERLQAERVSQGSRAGEYPLPGPVTRGFQRTREGAYELSLNGARLRIGPKGDLDIRAAGALRLEGEIIVSNARSSAAQ